MKKTITAILAFFITMLNFTAIVGAQPMNQQVLNAKQQAIIPIAAFTASGNLDRLKTALNDGLDMGLSINEIKEILVQMYAYAGFPRSLNSIGVFMNVVDERQKNGIKDIIGKEATPLPANKSNVELGTENQTRLAGAPVKGSLYEFTPAIDRFLKGHLFGDIFARDNLDWQSREIATIAALSSMEGVAPQLQAHFNIGMNTGLDEAQMRNLIDVLQAKVGKAESERGLAGLKKVLQQRQP
jgi:alkylhydroperoxidase/carboxymuconolactone decarboxylase family protein YurZ